MRTVNPISATDNNRSPAEMIAALQEQMAMYAQYAGSIGTKANADYKAAQSALDAGNVLEAKVALIALQRAADSASLGPAPAPAAQSTAENVAPPQNGQRSNSLNTTA